MNPTSYHIPDHLIDAYAAGALPYAFAVVVAAHLSMCDDCRARAGAAEMLGGALMDRLEPVAMSGDARGRMMAALDAPVPRMRARPDRSGIFPAPVMEVLDGQPPKWRMLGGGIRQQILSADSNGSLRLLYIPPGRAVPEHGHRGLELTLVLQGGFSDGEGHFDVGDVECAQEDVDHQPTADLDGPCVVLAATDAPLRFHAMIPRLLQPIFRI